MNILLLGALVALGVAVAANEQAFAHVNTNRAATHVSALVTLLAASVAATCVVGWLTHAG